VVVAYLFLVRRNLVAFFALVAFWVGVGSAFSVLGARTALAFMGLWILGLAIVTLFHFQPLFFGAYEALLAAVLFILLRWECT
jgi:hypothetical protein